MSIKNSLSMRWLTLQVQGVSWSGVKGSRDELDALVLVFVVARYESPPTPFERLSNPQQSIFQPPKSQFMWSGLSLVGFRRQQTVPEATIPRKPERDISRVVAGEVQDINSSSKSGFPKVNLSSKKSISVQPPKSQSLPPAVERTRHI